MAPVRGRYSNYCFNIPIINHSSMLQAAVVASTQLLRGDTQFRFKIKQFTAIRTLKDMLHTVSRESCAGNNRADLDNTRR